MLIKNKINSLIKDISHCKNVSNVSQIKNKLYSNNFN